MFKKIGLLLLALILVLAACGDDGASLSAEEQEFADALAADLIADPDTPITSDTDASCVAEAIVAEYGLDRLGELEIDPGDRPEMAEFGPEMTEAERDAFVDIYFDCVDLQEAMAQSMVEEGGTPFTEADAKCIVERFDDDTLRQGMLTELSGEDWEPPLADLFAGIRECVDLQDLIYQSMLEQGLPESAARCVADGLDDATIESLFSGMIAGEDANPEEMPDFVELVMTCMG